MPDWKKVIEATQSEEDADDVGGEVITFGEPATAEQLAEVESALSLKLPAELRAALSQINGAEDYLGTSPLFSTEKLIEVNEATRADYADWDLEHPVENALLFNDIYGNGDLFGIVLNAFGDFTPGQVVLFDHETGEFSSSAPEAAESLEAFYGKCLPEE